MSQETGQRQRWFRVETGLELEPQVPWTSERAPALTPTAWGSPAELLGQPAGDTGPARPCLFKLARWVVGRRWEAGRACSLVLFPTHR